MEPVSGLPWELRSKPQWEPGSGLPLEPQWEPESELLLGPQWELESEVPSGPQWELRSEVPSEPQWELGSEVPSGPQWEPRLPPRVSQEAPLEAQEAQGPPLVSQESPLELQSVRLLEPELEPALGLLLGPPSEHLSVLASGEPVYSQA